MFVLVLWAPNVELTLVWEYTFYCSVVVKHARASYVHVNLLPSNRIPYPLLLAHPLGIVCAILCATG